MKPILSISIDSTIENLKTIAVSLDNISQSIGQNKEFYNILLIIIAVIFVYFFVKMMLAYFSEKRIDISIDNNNKALIEITKALTILNERVATLIRGK